MYTLELTNPKTKEVTTHTKDWVSAKNLITALKLNNEVYQDEVERTLGLVNYVAGLFDIKSDEILEGIQAHELMKRMYEIYYKVLGYSEKKAQRLIQIMQDVEMEEDLD
ncbi:phage tail assembly chaperone G [Rummeliibacillus stabekisii]|uniref:Phage protein n=1 Tax=Rummeliibacillus stabekisii TaxID=241244 RepID=A0A143H9P5_9BACL|nr:hypothetical protein [Rummeliibacillus stabekisii]AMW98454.1 hypothetical protein ATY39_02795 [Rummeliibacillus stabekisii]